jgi:pantothenate synthetase
MRATLLEGGIPESALDYAVVRDPHTLLAPAPGGPVRRLIAARVGAVRLIDNG